MCVCIVRRRVQSLASLAPLPPTHVLFYTCALIRTFAAYSRLILYLCFNANICRLLTSYTILVLHRITSPSRVLQCP